MKKQLSLLLMALLVSLSACFNEYDEGYEILGPVATIPVLTFSQAQPTAGSQITVNFRYYSENIEVKELRLVQTLSNATTTVSTKPVSGFNRDNSYEDSFTYTVPSVSAGTVINLGVEVVTTNDLTNARRANITVR
ncbi:hypothetical protein GCM10027275_31790 [Rhabdobacter roseus]|uniref:Uncharacterized protein n=1 Tax=Rhabdobacter roseus TaxID=1655419 RepID=A0A840TZS6_9BACT|nr:hypothetical protein [Rhabdobacter roseus]MBB5285139.1 hypothetical protein [Rhabdobacter roseus]